MENQNLFKSLLFGEMEVPDIDQKSLAFLFQKIPEMSSITADNDEDRDERRHKSKKSNSSETSPTNKSAKDQFSDSNSDSSIDNSQNNGKITNGLIDIFADENTRPSDFLESIGYEETHNIYKFSKLYYPPGKQEYRNLKNKFGFKTQKIRNLELTKYLNEIDLNDFQQAIVEDKKIVKSENKSNTEKRKIEKLIQNKPNFGPEFFQLLRKKIMLRNNWTPEFEESIEEIEKENDLIIPTEENHHQADESSFLTNFQRKFDIEKDLWGDITKEPSNIPLGEVAGDLGGEQEINLREIILSNCSIRNEYISDISSYLRLTRNIQKSSKKIKRIKSRFDRIFIAGDRFGIFYDDVVKKNLIDTRDILEAVNDGSLLNNSQIGNDQPFSQSRIQKSEGDSLSISSKPLAMKANPSQQKAQKNREKEQRILAVLQGHDPNSIQAEENALSKKNDVNMPDQSILSMGIESKVATRHGRLQHAVLTESLMFEDYRAICNNSYEFHRPDIRQNCSLAPWRVRIVKEDTKKTTGDITEVVDSHEYFKTQKRLSCIRGNTILFQNIEENPLLLQIVGMRSKISRYIYPSRVKNVEDRNSFRNEITEKFGQMGNLIFLQSNEKIPLLGQLTQEKNIGIIIVENNLFRAPIFVQSLPETDFLLVRLYDDEKKTHRYALRAITEIYIVGQIEPKLEVFAPNSRSNSKFIRKSIRHIIREYFRKTGIIDVRDLVKEFPLMNEHNLKKNVREMGGEQDYSDPKIFRFSQFLFDEMEANGSFQKDSVLTPEDICLYERMTYSLNHLKNFGLRKMTSADKILIALNKFCKRNPSNFRMHVIARLITEELQLTTWNLSQSFLVARQTQGRLFLSGYGDPTNGHGGISYVKKPLKSSRHEKDEDNDEDDKLAKVTGTSADLRKLETPEMKRILLSHGCNPEYLQTLSRWDKVDLLRRVSNMDSQDGLNRDSELAKFSRTLRVTTKMQREKYQKEINRQLALLIENMQLIESQCHQEVEENLKENPEIMCIDELVKAEKKSFLLKRRVNLHHNEKNEEGEKKHVKTESN